MGKKKKQRKPIKKRYSNACTELLFAYCAQDPFVAREYFPRKQTLSVETNRTEKYMGKASNKSSGFDFWMDTREGETKLLTFEYRAVSEIKEHPFFYSWYIQGGPWTCWDGDDSPTLPSYFSLISYVPFFPLQEEKGKQLVIGRSESQNGNEHHKLPSPGILQRKKPHNKN